MTLNLPILFLNFKTYEEATADKAVSLALSAQEVSSRNNVSIVLVVQAVDIRLVAETTALPIFAQHVDSVGFGSNTGFVNADAVKRAGAIGTVLNHAEHKLSNDVLIKSILKAKESGLIVMVCAESKERAVEIASFEVKPDFIAFEPPELIGGDISVSTALPEILEETVKAVSSVSNVPVITGAGIKNQKDASLALKLGTRGIFVASGIIKAVNQKKALEEITQGFD